MVKRRARSAVPLILNTVIRFVCALVLTIAIIPAAPPAQAPGQSPKKTPATPYFSGTVTDFKPDSITVVRKPPAKDPITRTFLLDANTTIEGTIRTRARVTVRYSAAGNGAFRAIHIIVRQ
jgi:hypothetical protein